MVHGEKHTQFSLLKFVIEIFIVQLRGMHGIPSTTVKKNNKHVVFEDKVSVEGEEIELNVVKK